MSSALEVEHAYAELDKTMLHYVTAGRGPPVVGDFSQGGRCWHHQFHTTPDLPKTPVQGREDVYLRWFYRDFSYRPYAIGEEDVQEYLRAYRQPGSVVPNCGHFIPEEPPEILFRLLLDFFAEEG